MPAADRAEDPVRDPAPPWVDARHRRPRDGQLVLAAITGRYPPESGRTSSPDDDFWLVLPMHFRRVHPTDGADSPVQDCYLDADHIVRRTFGSGQGGEEVTHWAPLPDLPGQSVSQIVGATVATARASALEASEAGGQPPTPAVTTDPRRPVATPERPRRSAPGPGRRS